MIRRLFSHTAIYGLAPYIPKLLGLVTLPIITKDLTGIDYGVAGVVGAYVGSVGVLSTLGMRLTLVNSFYHYTSQYKWLWRQIYGFLSLWTVVFGMIVSVLLFFIIPNEAHSNTWLIVVLNVIPLILFGPVGLIGNTYFQLKEKPMQIAMRSAFFGVLTIVLNLYFISVLKLGYMGWFWADCIVSLMHNASYWYAINVVLGFKPIYNFKIRLIKRSLRVTLPMIPHYYSSYLLNSSDRMIMDWLKIRTEEIGRYNVSANFGNYFNSISMASGFAVAPMLNRFYKEGRDTDARNLLWILQLLFLAGTFFICLWLREIFFILIKNTDLRKMYSIAVIIVMAYNYRPMYLGSSAKVFYQEKSKLLWRVTVVAGIMNVSLNIVLVPIFGVGVAAVATFVSYMYMGYVSFFLSGYRSIIGVKYYPVWWLLATVVLTLSAYYLVELGWWIKITISSFLLLCFLFLFLRLRVAINDHNTTGKDAKSQGDT